MSPDRGTDFNPIGCIGGYQTLFMRASLKLEKNGFTPTLKLQETEKIKNDRFSVF